MEKILEPGEELPASWPVAGTTGYDAMREVNGVFIDHDHERDFTLLYQRLTGDQRMISDHIEAGKRMAVEVLTAGRGATDGSSCTRRTGGRGRPC